MDKLELDDRVARLERRVSVLTAIVLAGLALITLMLVMFTTRSDPQAFPLTMAWDLDGDGQFNDASGTNAARVFASAFSGHIGLHVTNTADRTSIAYSYLNVADTNRPPVFTSLNPTGIVANVTVGGVLNFNAGATDPEGAVVEYRWLVDGVEAGTGS